MQATRDERIIRQAARLAKGVPLSKLRGICEYQGSVKTSKLSRLLDELQEELRLQASLLIELREGE